MTNDEVYFLKFSKISLSLSTPQNSIASPSLQKIKSHLISINSVSSFMKELTINLSDKDSATFVSYSLARVTAFLNNS